MIQVREHLYNVQEILQEHITDFDIMREKPLTFCAGGHYIVCAPVRFYEHGMFIRDLVRSLTRYAEIFQKVEFLTSGNFQEQSAVSRAIGQVTVFSNSRQYQEFISREVPAFVKRWALTIKGKKLVKIRNARKLLGPFSADEILQVFFTLFVFNYDIVKKKTFDFLARLQTGQLRNTTPSGSGMGKVFVMPKYSEKPYSKQDLELFEKQSTMN
jgi:hypothetical protein